jgi:hypothetical protein
LIPSDARCQIKKASKARGDTETVVAEERCGRKLDEYGDHTLICNCGGGRYRRHGGITKLLTSFAKEAGCRAEEEVTVPELLCGEPGTENAVEARLDIHVWATSPWPLELWIDATFRHPWAQRYREDAALYDGAAAATAEADKRDRYGVGIDGVVVTPAALESWGWLSDGLEWVLGCLQARRAALHGLSGQAASTLGRRWRQELGIAQVRAFHAVLVEASRQAISGSAVNEPDEL